MNDKLAMLGGTPTVRPENRRLEWPIVTQADRDAVLGVLDTGKFTVGAKNEQEIHALESEWAEFCGTRYAVSVNSGTVALELALSALGLQPGDEVIVPALSYVATAMAPLYSLAVPVFVDIDPVTFNIDVTQIEAKITSRTRAIVPVHLAAARRHGRDPGPGPQVRPDRGRGRGAGPGWALPRGDGRLDGCGRGVQPERREEHPHLW